MDIYIMTDLEAVAGVIDSDNWCVPDSEHLSEARRLLSLEVNAAVEGFVAAGATRIHVADGHGYGGIDANTLDPRVELISDFPCKYPCELDGSFDAMAWVGQHAKSRTCFAHLAHTGAFTVFEKSLNGLAIGELGEMALCAGELGVPAILLTGDQAGCDEAAKLISGIETVAVKRGIQTQSGDSCTAEEYGFWNLGVVQDDPGPARTKIRAGAQRALERFKTQPTAPVTLSAPYARRVVMRPDAEHPYQRVSVETHDTSAIAALNSPYDLKPVT
jgi:D-amino peptidase